STDAGQCVASAVSLGAPSISDNCPGATVSNDAPASFAKGATTVTWTVTDASGNTATASQLVTVNDTQNPTITAPAAVAVSSDAGHCFASTVALGAPSISDNCPVARVSSNAPTRFPNGATTVTWTVTGASGNTATGSQLGAVNDTQSPTIRAPAAVVVSSDPGHCHATNVALGTPTTADNCAVASVTSNAPTQFPAGATTVTWTVTD